MLTEKYNHKEIEKKWQEYWRANAVYKWRNDLPREQTFVIDTPPPTVSGVLHMGHVFSYTQADFVARFQRMSGKDVFYPMGFDDNGLPTERLVEKVKNIRVGTPNVVSALGDSALTPQPSKGTRLLAREDFIAECKSVVDEAEQEFEAMFNSIALSVDWEQKYQTISPQSQKISQASFVDLHKKGFVEKKFEPVFWDISDRTALAQADLIDKEVEGEMNYILFEIDGSDEKIEIMTTRPELLPACVAVMIKKGGKWSHLSQKSAITPIFGVKVPIVEVEDDSVIEEKGTGAVMCCTFGDETDIKWWRKYNLDLRVIFGEDGKMIESDKTWLLFENARMAAIQNEEDENFNNFKKIYSKLCSGKKIKETKDAIINELKSQNLPLKQEKITRAVKCAERSGVPIEILVKPQWFIKIIDKKEALKQKAKECNWFPEYMQVRIEQWIDGLSWDWCISRQRFFGVPIPAWQVRKNQHQTIDLVIADFDELPVDPRAIAPKGFTKISEFDGFSYAATKNGEEYTIFPETDILDTWATSSVSPQLSSGAINEEMLQSLLNSGAINQTQFAEKLQRHQKLFPADMRPQAHEIIRTWAFYTIVKAHLHEDKIPWENLMISGWCLAADKSKMSKSKGNVVTPTSLIEEKSSDIVRYWASTSHLGADTAYSEDVFKIGQKLVTKLFNAAKFVAINFAVLDDDAAAQQNQGSAPSPLQLVASKTIFCAADLWILSRLHQTVAQATASFEKFEYARAREKIEEFFWHDFCDNYLEIVKVRSYGLKAEKLAGRELNENEKQEIIAKQLSGIHTLKICLETLLKLFAPFIPHICEEIYSGIFAKEFATTKSINARGTWPKIEAFFFEQNACSIGEAALSTIFEVRKFKSDNNLSMKTTLQKLTVRNPLDLSPILEDLGNVCNALELDFSKGEAKVVIETAIP